MSTAHPSFAANMFGKSYPKRSHAELVTSASLVVTSALLVVTRSY